MVNMFDENLLSGWPSDKLYINNLREKNSHLDQDSNPGLQLYALAL